MFSVVIPIYNHARFLEQAVASALRSPLVSEVLLLDDGSQDGSATLAAKLAAGSDSRVRDCTPKGGGNRGAHERLNQLIEAARCEWVSVLNSDDIFVARRFEVLAALPGFYESDFLFGHLLFINERGALIGAKRGPTDPGTPFPAHFRVQQMVAAGQFLDLLAHQNFLGTTSNMVFRKSLHSRIGGFRPYRYVHDWDFALRAVVLGVPLYVRRFITGYRMHAANTISEGPRRVDAEAEVLFARFLADFPNLRNRPDFALALQNNANGVSIAQAALAIAGS
jgi:glycosyltransferase involved in cell wall biosynthesis